MTVKSPEAGPDQHAIDQTIQQMEFEMQPSAERVNETFDIEDIEKTGELAVEASLEEGEADSDSDPQPKWEKLGNRLNKMAHVLTDLPPEVFRTYTYQPSREKISNSQGSDPTLTESGEKIYELGIDPEALGELPAGNYRVHYGRDIDIEIIEDEEGNKFFNFTAVPEDKQIARQEEYDALADAKPDEVERPLDGYRGGSYTGGLLDAMESLTEERLTPTIRAHYESMGFKVHIVDGKTRLLPPSPQTLRKLAEDKKLPLRFVQRAEDGLAQVSEEAYAGSFEDGLYPIGVSELLFYMHDVSNDHLPGIFKETADGKSLLTEVSPLVKKAIQTSNNQGLIYLDDITTKNKDLVRVFDEAPTTGQAVFSNEVSRQLGAISEAYQDFGLSVGEEVNVDDFKITMLSSLREHVRSLRDSASETRQRLELLDTLIEQTKSLAERNKQTKKDAIPRHARRG